MSSAERHWLLTSVVAPIVIAVVIGMGAGYVATQVALATFDERMARVESDLGSALERERASAERMIRLETKIDMLLTRGAK